MSKRPLENEESPRERATASAVAAFTPAPKAKGRLAKLAKRAGPEPVHEDPIEELRRLTRQHANWTKTSVALHHMRSDRTKRDTGDTIACLLPATTRADLELAQQRLDEADDGLKREMARALKKTRIWREWLGEVAGIGEIIGAQLVGEIDIAKATKASSLKLFCGVCPDARTGRLVRRTSGEKNRYHAGLRTCLYQGWVAIRRNAAKLGKTCKYFEIWENAKFSARNDPRFDIKANTWTGTWGPDGKQSTIKAGQHFIDARGMWKSVDIFVEDLYVVWRALEGLPVWPDWYDVRRGHVHGGQPLGWSGPRIIPVDEAIRMIGDVGWRAVADIAAE